MAAARGTPGLLVSFPPAPGLQGWPGPPVPGRGPRTRLLVPGPWRGSSLSIPARAPPFPLGPHTLATLSGKPALFLAPPPAPVPVLRLSCQDHRAPGSQANPPAAPKVQGLGFAGSGLASNPSRGPTAPLTPLSNPHPDPQARAAPAPHLGRPGWRRDRAQALEPRTDGRTDCTPRSSTYPRLYIWCPLLPPRPEKLLES